MRLASRAERQLQPAVLGQREEIWRLLNFEILQCRISLPPKTIRKSNNLRLPGPPFPAQFRHKMMVLQHLIRDRHREGPSVQSVNHEAVIQTYFMRVKSVLA